MISPQAGLDFPLMRAEELRHEVGRVMHWAECRNMLPKK
jgi:hypothetical protein